MNVNFGLSDYGRLKYMMKITDQVKEKKKIDKISAMEGVSQNEKAELVIQLAETNSEINETLAEMQEYAKNNKSYGVVVYAQFQSMSGRDKFFKAINNVGWCMRCCSNRHNDKQ